ncbi:type VI secretion system contractile sheath small subunit [Litoreibacter albidus]|uniref:Type VI secretion system protein ImpB n=1 Tax=Litoreibacter albidus TaxID=670155 RepID=A0A1H3D8P5_9RHOB|nr:type VI secretion system contractile sheath small subunit [Litoreibacter albidus]SDX62892.1 type VI secretion system protein ImpB [Litoreibacter albidus]
MASDSATGFIKRNRPPRVNISYADPYESDKMVELPFVMGIMSDLSGNASEVEKPPVAEREFTRVDQDSLDDYMGAVSPGIAMQVDNRLDPDSGTKMSVNLNFKKMEDLSPGEVARQVPALAKLLEARTQLANLQRYMNGKSAAQDQIKALLEDPELMAALAERAPAAGDDAEE